MPSHTMKWYENSDKFFETNVEVDYTHHLKELYRRIHEWLQVEHFYDFQGAPFYETMYWQRDRPNGNVDHNIWWRAWKHPGAQKGGDMQQFRWFLKIEIQTINIDMTAKTMHMGKQFRTYKGNTKIFITGFVIREYEKWFSEYPILKYIQNRFSNWIYRDRIDAQEDEIRAKCFELTDTIKAFLEIKQQEETPPDIHPPSELPRPSNA